MKRMPKMAPGVFVRIPLADGSFGYGRVLANPYMAFYNYRTAEPLSDVDIIGSMPILFKQAVRLVGDNPWVNIGKRKLEGEVAKPVVQFMQGEVNFKDCVIFDAEGMEKHVTPEECIGIERASVWDMRHIEQRLLDTFKGRPNEDEVRARVRLE